MAQTDSQSRREEELESYEVIDCDCHYMESFTDVAEYMEEPWKTRFEKSGFDEKGAKQNLSSFFPFSTGDRQAYGKIDREYSSYPDEPETPERIREGMASIGVNKTLLISHLVLAGAGSTADDERQTAFAKAYVEYMQEEVLDPDDGIFGLAPIPYSDIDASLEILDRVEGEEAYKGACFVTAGAALPLGNRKYDPLYKRCEEMDLPAVFHTGGAGLDEYVRGGYEEMIETHTLGFLESNMSQIVSLVCRGVPEKFPDLDIAFMESGVTYLPGLIARLDEEYLKRPEEAPMLEKKPGEYITDFYYGTQPLEISADPEFLAKSIDMVGTDSLMFASDYPHWDYDRPTTVLDLPSLSEEEKRAVLHENAAEVFDL
ncbi:amidohydrolase family protein [Halococcus hamelinensis]|uniref:Amidohydrolase 2 n=1 Tax=Halococcus hamelinensis 100A6 TaxID=1132509 RepID=M0LUN0_9EURY|nr:amidohydrolase family protein [Halococcus hamelinensis]EMA37277.1 amidohydrolase 2 [Halococcus hamelinensis 100A6]